MDWRTKSQRLARVKKAATSPSRTLSDLESAFVCGAQWADLHPAWRDARHFSPNIEPCLAGESFEVLVAYKMRFRDGTYSENHFIGTGRYTYKGWVDEKYREPIEVDYWMPFPSLHLDD